MNGLRSLWALRSARPSSDIVPTPDVASPIPRPRAHPDEIADLLARVEALTAQVRDLHAELPEPQAVALSSEPGARRWSVALPIGLHLVNSNRITSNHDPVQHRRLVRLRTAAVRAAREAEVPPCQRIHVRAVHRPGTDQPRDVANLYPSVKACVDGLVLAGVIPDDNDAHLLGPDPRPGERLTLTSDAPPSHEHGQLILIITDLGPALEH